MAMECCCCENEIGGDGYFRLGEKIYCSEACVLEDLGVCFEWIENEEEEADRERHDLSA